MSINVKSLYIHYPYCRHRCNFCDFYKQDWKEDSTQDFWKRFKTEWKTLVEFHNSHQVEIKELETLYLGGGTPSLMGDELKNLVSYLDDAGIYFSKNYEFTVEVNPEDITKDLLNKLEQAGVNRLSMGIQTLNSSILPFMDRAHDLKQIMQSLKLLSDWKKALSLDLMLGLPYSQKFQRNIIQEIEELLTLSPSHLSLYILKPAKDYLLKNFIPDDDYIEVEYQEVSHKLTVEGYSHYEVSNFAKLDQESKHNLAYWKGHSTAALGASGVGFINFTKKAVRYKWQAHKPEIIPEFLNQTQIQIESFYLGTRLKAGINLKDFFVGRFFEQAVAKAKKWESEGFCSLDASGHVSLNSKGFLLHDAFVDDFLNLIR